MTDQLAHKGEIMTDELSWLLGKKIAMDIHVCDGQIYIIDELSGDPVYILSPKIWKQYHDWLDARPLLKALS